MKGITGNPALDAYQRMAITPVTGAKPAEKVEGGGGHSTGEAAKVTISAAARDLALHAASGGADAEKDQALRAKIQDGSFKIDPKAVATKLVDDLG